MQFYWHFCLNNYLKQDWIMLWQSGVWKQKKLVHIWKHTFFFNVINIWYLIIPIILKLVWLKMNNLIHLTNIMIPWSWNLPGSKDPQTNIDQTSIRHFLSDLCQININVRVLAIRDVAPHQPYWMPSCQIDPSWHGMPCLFDYLMTSHWQLQVRLSAPWPHKMMSSNGDIFRVTGPLCGSLVNSPHKSRWRRALVFSLICAWINGWVNNREAGDLRCHHAYYDVTVMPHTGLYLIH